MSPPRMFLRSGSLVASRTYPFRAAVPPLGGPAPAAKQPGLLRLLNANYFPVNAYFTDAAGKRVAMAELIAHDGRRFRDTSNPDAPARPVSENSPMRTGLIDFGAAERYDMLLRPPGAGDCKLTVDLPDWITGSVLHPRTIPVIAR